MCPEIFRKFPGKLRRILKKKIRNFSGKTLENRYIFLKKISPKKPESSGHFPELADYRMLPTGRHGVCWCQAYSHRRYRRKDPSCWGWTNPGILRPPIPPSGGLNCTNSPENGRNSCRNSFRIHLFYVMNPMTGSGVAISR